MTSAPTPDSQRPPAERPHAERSDTSLDNLTPRQIVAELDKYVVGQRAAKRSVAIALRNRWRRQQLAPGLRMAVEPDPRSQGRIPSTKGSLEG